MCIYYLTSKSTSAKQGPIPIDDEQIMSLSPIEGEVIIVDSKISTFSTREPISYPIPPTDDREGSGSTLGSSSSNSDPDEIPMLNAQDFGTCAYSENSLFQQIFGNTVKCNDYFDDKHRIQTKVYNENYLIFASIGVSAKYL